MKLATRLVSESSNYNDNYQNNDSEGERLKACLRDRQGVGVEKTMGGTLVVGRLQW